MKLQRLIRPLGTVLVLAMLMTLVISTASAQEGPKVLRLAYTQEPGILVDYFTDLGVSWVNNRIYSQPPWGMDDKFNVIPTLVDELPSVENGGVIHENGKTTVKFRIADWAVWSDGVPITADDFILVNDLYTDGITNTVAFRYVNGAQIDSVTQGETDKDVVITFAQYQPDWVSAAFIPLPNHVLREQYEAALSQKKGFDTLTDWLRAPTVGCGPFVFAEWESGSYIRYVRNENYWKPVWFDEVQVNFYPDTNVIKQLLISGETDFTAAVPFLEAVQLHKDHPEVNLLTGFSGGRMELQFNFGDNGNPALKDVRVRRAIAMAIDRQGIVDTLYDGQTEVPRSYWYGTPWFYKDTPYIDYDPEGAKALLREAGWYDENGDGVVEAHGVEGVEDGTPLALTASTYAGGGFTEYQDVLLAIQDYLKDVGIPITISTYEVNVMHSSFTADSPFSTGADDLYVLGWGVGVESINQIQLWACDAIPSEQNPYGLNGSKICVPEMDQLWKELGTELDPAKRQEAANKIQQLIADQVLMVSMVNLNDAYLTQGLENVSMGNAGTYWYSIDQWQRSS